MTEALQKLIENGGWRPIERFSKKGGEYLLRGEGFVWVDFWRECSNGDAYWEEQDDFEPTHFMPLNTPEVMAKVIAELVETLEIIKKYDPTVSYQGAMADQALQWAEEIAGKK